MINGDREARILVEACRPDGQAADLREAIQGGLDWDRLTECSISHSVLPLLYRRLEQASATVPPRILESVSALCRPHVIKSLRFSADLVGLVRLLHEKGIDCVPLKGPVLAQYLYGDCAARQFTDLDLLVREEQVGELWQLLTSKGFRARQAYSPRQLRQHVRRTCEVSFNLPSSGLLLDVHWRVMADYVGAELEPGVLLREKRNFIFQGEEVSTLSDEHYLLYLAVHGAFHRWDRLVWIADFAAMASRLPGREWGTVLKSATRFGIRRMLLTGLAVAARLEYLRLDPAVQAAVQNDVAANRLAVRILRNLFTSNEATIQNTNRFLLESQQSLGRKLRYCFTRAFIPTVADWQRVNLPDSLYFLYYVVRPLRIMEDCRREKRRATK